MTLFTFTVLALAALSIMLAISEFFDKKKILLSRRTLELKQVEKLLHHHYDALEYLFNDPATPDEIADVLLFLSASISNKHRAKLIAKSVLDEDVGEYNGEYSLSTDIDALRKSRPDIVSEIEKALKTGFTALLLRWPEISYKSEIYLSEAARQDTDRYIVRAVKTVRSEDCGDLVALPA